MYLCLVDNRGHSPASGTADEAIDGGTAASDTTAATTAGEPRETETGPTGNYSIQFIHPNTHM